MSNKSNTILVTGATGTVGKSLIPLLHKNGYKVHALVRKKVNITNASVFLWDVEKQFIDTNAFENVTHIIHLAGEGIADKRWTTERKKQIIDSRVNSAKLLLQCVIQNKVKLQKFISASAVGYYGADATDKYYTEQDKAGADFLATCCMHWEQAADAFADMASVVKIRLGVVLDKKSGAYPKLTMPIKLGFAAAIGKGTQPLPWIHCNDVCAVFCKAIQTETMIGVYNAVAPEMHTNQSFTKTAAKALHRPYFLPNVPAFILKAIFGELSVTFLNGQKVSPEKLLNNNFEFEFPNLEFAIKNLISQ